MTESPVIVGVEPTRAEHADAVTLGALLARLTDSPLLLVSVYEPRQAPWHHPGVAYEHALHKAVVALSDKLEGVTTEELVLPGGSAARVLHSLADERRASGVVVGSSPHATWGHVDLGHVSQRLLHGGGTAMAVAPRGYAGHGDGFASIAVGFAGTPESEDALSAAAELAAAAGAELHVITVFDPADYVHVMHRADGEGELRAHARRELDDAVARLDGVSATGELLDGDPAELLTRLSDRFDLLVVGSRSYGPLRAVLLGGVSGILAHGSGCPLVVVPHMPAPDHDAPLVGGLEATRGA